MTTVIAKTVTKAVMPIIMLISFALLLQGHNLPGGGFIGGVLTAVAFGLAYIVFSIDYFEKNILNRKSETHSNIRSAMQEKYRNIFVAGLVLSIGTGITAIFFDLPFLSQDFWIIHLPIFKEFHIASAFAFDLGVYLVVVGALATIISAVGEE